MEQTINKIGIIGDFHAKDNLSYHEYIKDQRVSEKKEILDFIVKSFADCSSVVFIGDNFDKKNNSSEVIKDFIEFVERFSDKQVYVISGNHEIKGNGKSAIDFMREVNKPNWHIMTSPMDKIIGGHKIHFLPYMSRPQLGVQNDKEGCDKLLSGMSGGKAIFAHHAISDTFAAPGLSTNSFHEIVLPKIKLEEIYKNVIAGHIHRPQQDGRTTITGSVFTSEVGEIEKYIWKLDLETDNVERLKLPCRGIFKLENPTEEQLNRIPSNSIVKVIITSKEVNIDLLKSTLRTFDAYILLEQYPNERKKVYFDEGAIDFSLDNLFKIYSIEKKVDLDKLKKGMELISG